MAPRQNQDSGSAVGEGSEREDRELVRAALTTPELFGHLYDRYVNLVFGYCYRRLNSRWAAEDATSVIFLKAVSGLSGYQKDAPSFRTWLFTIAHHTVIDAYRSAQADSLLDLSTEARSTSAGPEESALSNEAERELYALIKQLPADQEHLI